MTCTYCSGWRPYNQHGLQRLSLGNVIMYAREERPASDSLSALWYFRVEIWPSLAKHSWKMFCLVEGHTAANERAAKHACWEAYLEFLQHVGAGPIGHICAPPLPESVLLPFP
mgnify:FL=1